MKCPTCEKKVVAVIRCHCEKWLCKHCRYEHKCPTENKSPTDLPPALKSHRGLKDRI